MAGCLARAVRRMGDGPGLRRRAEHPSPTAPALNRRTEHPSPPTSDLNYRTELSSPPAATRKTSAFSSPPRRQTATPSRRATGKTSSSPAMRKPFTAPLSGRRTAASSSTAGSSPPSSPKKASTALSGGTGTKRRKSAWPRRTPFTRPSPEKSGSPILTPSRTACSAGSFP